MAEHVAGDDWRGFSLRLTYLCGVVAKELARLVSLKLQRRSAVHVYTFSLPALEIILMGFRILIYPTVCECSYLQQHLTRGGLLRYYILLDQHGSRKSTISSRDDLLRWLPRSSPVEKDGHRQIRLRIPLL